MTVIAAVLCVLFPLREALNAPMLERRQTGWQLQTVIQRDRLMSATGLLLLTAAVVIGYTAESLWFALTGMAFLLLGAALLLPLVLRVLLGALAKLIPKQNARLSWLLADSRWLLGPASLALMAMTLALVANSGLNTMISSFRTATDDWLSQRLVADLYLRGQQELNGLEQWLAAEMPELKVAERFLENFSRSTPSGHAVPVEVISLRPGGRFRDSVTLMDNEPDAVSLFENSEGIYISERAWRIDGWQVGQTLDLCKEQPETKVLGVYRDYGNPSSQWMVSRQLFKECWPQKEATGLSIHGPESTDWDQVRAVIAGNFGLESVLVAAIGIFCAVSAIHHHRVGQQALLSSLGLTRRERGALLLLQWGMLGLLCMALVWPFGTMLAAYLGSVVTPAAFGWSFPLRLEWGHYLVLAILAVASLVVAVLLPSLRLLHSSPAAMLREQNL
jgi:putative ABC transport system permease protein